MTESAQGARRSVLIRHVEPVIAGTLMCGAVIAAGAGRTKSISDLSLAIVITVGVYWISHLYVATLAGVVREDRRPWAALTAAVTHSWMLAAASLLPLGVLVSSNILGAKLPTAASIALLSTVGLLAAYSVIAARRGGLSSFGCTLAGLGGAGLGLTLGVLKAFLH